jgi:integrase
MGDLERRRFVPSVIEAEIPPPKRKPKGKANSKHLTDKNVLTLPVNGRQHFVWDAGTDAVRGLCVLVNPTGTRTYFVNYRFPGSKKLHYKKLGRVGDMKLAQARELARKARELAAEGKDPKADDPTKSDPFETVFETYIKEEQKGRKNNSSADETRGAVLYNCAELKPRAVATIAYRDISSLLNKIRDGDPEHGRRPRAPTAVRIHAHLGDFFGWCARERIIKEDPMANMPSPATLKNRERYFSDEELRVIWRAADQLDVITGSYVKLMMLLALRKDELAEASWNEFDSKDEPTLFTVPTERAKMKAAAKLIKKPVYRVPLPPLAQRILKGLRRDGESRLFPGLEQETRDLKTKLCPLGVPNDFKLHIFRHTVSTYLENTGRSEWERGLVLNHGGGRTSGSTVTAGYSHGFPLELKRRLMIEWAEHVERLVSQAEGVARLR